MARLSRTARVRLDRALSKLNAASRGEAKRLIQDGRVRVDGRVVTDPARLVVLEASRITIEGRLAQPLVWRAIALHKPRGIVTTRRDPEGRRTVFDLLGDEAQGLIAVGRLDMASTGLLLLTTDTQLAHYVTNPANAIIRRYVVTARGAVTDADAARMVDGIAGFSAASVTIRKRSARETHLIVELTEGKNREIRRLLEAVGHEVTRLLRVAVGGIELQALGPGEWRELDRAEIAAAFPGGQVGSTKPR